VYTHTVLELGDDCEWRERGIDRSMGNDLKLAAARLLKSRSWTNIKPVMADAKSTKRVSGVMNRVQDLQQRISGGTDANMDNDKVCTSYSPPPLFLIPDCVPGALLWARI
jgi:hypothetical protein